MNRFSDYYVDEMINRAFTWDATPEGHSFWCTLYSNAPKKLGLENLVEYLLEKDALFKFIVNLEKQKAGSFRRDLFKALRKIKSKKDLEEYFKRKRKEEEKRIKEKFKKIKFTKKEKEVLRVSPPLKFWKTECLPFLPEEKPGVRTVLTAARRSNSYFTVEYTFTKENPNYIHNHACHGSVMDRMGHNYYKYFFICQTTRYDKIPEDDEYTLEAATQWWTWVFGQDPERLPPPYPEVIPHLEIYRDPDKASKEWGQRYLGFTLEMNDISVEKLLNFLQLTRGPHEMQRTIRLWKALVDGGVHPWFALWVSHQVIVVRRGCKKNWEDPEKWGFFIGSNERGGGHIYIPNQPNPLLLLGKDSFFFKKENPFRRAKRNRGSLKNMEGRRSFSIYASKRIKEVVANKSDFKTVYTVAGPLKIKVKKKDKKEINPFQSLLKTVLSIQKELLDLKE